MANLFPFRIGDRVTVQGCQFEGVIYTPGTTTRPYSLIEFPALGVKRWIPRSRLKLIQTKGVNGDKRFSDKICRSIR